MANLDGFNAEEHQEMGSFEVIPKGEYLALITDSEMKPTQSGSGEYLQLSWQLIDPQHKGRIVFDRLNLKNQNATAVKIANSALSGICKSVGILRPKDSVELHNKPVMLKIDVEERSDKPGVYKNIIKGYASPSAQKSVETKQDSSVPPWKK
jgi:hypothetical protein